ncbi:hypothetical protein PYW07_015055 [Mythimna separata]|uniref:Uncharacterized protein n=1 Tax=Mythimna separata TaxID=271217 RepID=A0AAD7YYR9_MYTSE|nr:hypothetical protein PYW07_015055 [Mythimna separata]
MNPKLVVVLYLCIASVFSAPMQLPFLPMQYGMQSQLPFLRNMVPNLQSPLYPQQQPLVIVLPNAGPNSEADNRNVNLNEQMANINLKMNNGHIDENKDAIVVDAKPETQSKNAVVYLANEGRYAIGQIISYIPFLPIEVNVPDTISWITNLITGGIFRPQGQVPIPSMKTLNNQGQMPIVVMPYPGAMNGVNH